MKNILQVDYIQKVYGNRGNVTKALNGVSFNIKEGEFIGIMGASGSGKSTLLNCISTIDTVTSGHIFIEGCDVTQLKGKELSKFRREKLGFIFQDYNLLDTLTAYENISLALSILHYPVEKISSRIEEVSKALNISDVLHKYPYQMSGGQQQRIACARAISTKPSLLLADEPTGALDSKSSELLLKSIEKLNAQQNATILMVTHDAYTASYSNRIIFIKDGQIFNELYKGTDSRKMFFDKIIEVQSVLGGGIEGDEF